MKRKSEGHCWIEFDKYIIDVTATQFIKAPKILITLKDDEGSIYYEKIYKDFEQVKDTEDRLKKWPQEQNPYHFQRVHGKIVK